MVRFLNKIYDKLKNAASAGDELIEASQEPAARITDEKTSEGISGSTPELIEGIDFYWEGAYMVMTEHYLLNRGFCCASGCRHCPYGFSKSDGERRTADDERE